MHRNQAVTLSLHAEECTCKMYCLACYICGVCLHPASEACLVKALCVQVMVSNGSAVCIQPHRMQSIPGIIGLT